MVTRRDILKGTLCFAGMATLYPYCSFSAPIMRKAMFWETKGDAVRCFLCPRNCILKQGATGSCRIRQNVNGALVTHGYGNPCAVHVDPIEKKPLYHVMPGAKALSIAVAGCNFHCKNCQNYSISQASPQETDNTDLMPEAVIESALKNKCETIAYTYSEPTVWFEYMYDTAKLARNAGLKNLMITCGYINPEPLKELSKYMDAANIDLKSFSDDVYIKLNAGRLQPVLDSIKLSRDLGIWVEITNLIVPQWTDSPDMIRKLCAWIKSTVGTDVPLHFSRFYPMYKLAHLYPTPDAILHEAKKIAVEAGLNYVYVGNAAGVDSNTYCPKCKKAVVKRNGYLITANDVKNGKCGFCGNVIPGIW